MALSLIPLGAAAAAAPPSAPQSLTVGPTLAGVRVVWYPPADDGGAPVTEFRVYKAVEAEPMVLVATLPYDPGPLWIDRAGAAPGTRLRYSVVAVNEAGAGPAAEAIGTVPRDGMLLRTGESRLYAMDANGGPLLEIDPVPTPTKDSVGVSPDGRWIAYVERSGDRWQFWDLIKRRLAGSMDGERVRLVSGTEELGGIAGGSVAWSPDGSRIAYARHDNVEGDIDLWTVPVAGGAPTQAASGLAEPAWLPDARTLLGRDPANIGPVVAVAPDGSRSDIPGSGGAFHPTVSPDGRWLAVSRRVGTQPTTEQVELLPLAGQAAPAPYGPVSGVVRKMSWRPDGRALLIQPGLHAQVELVDVAADGEFGAGRAFPGAGIWQGMGLAVAPSPAATGATAALAFDTSALAPGTTTTCALDGGTPEPCASPWRATGLAAGRHTVRLLATDPSGRAAAAARSWTVDLEAPDVSLVAPTANTTLASQVAVTATATDPGSGIAGYDFRYRRARWDGGFGAYVQPVSWTGTAEPTVTLSPAPGYEYCVSARAHDGAGNVSTWSAERCLSRPFDDRALAAGTGWTRDTGSSFYLGTATTTRRTGALLSRTGVQARHLVLVATTCPACGKVTVYLGSVKIGVAQLRSEVTTRRVLIPLPSLPAVTTGKLRLVVSSPTGQRVQVDGVAVRRR